MIHVDLFSGIGGIALAAKWAGFKTRLFCEIEPYCRKVLTKHWPKVPIHDDIRTLTQATLRENGIEEIALLTGGFPCQPFSCAGKRRGKKDDRYLWPEMLRVIEECRPAWVVGENVAGFIRLGLDGALADLERAGYSCRTFVFPTCAVQAPHERARCFLVANATSQRLSHDEKQFLLSTQSRKKSWCCWRTLAPSRLQRVADGVPHRVDRLRILGNAVVPQQIFPILQGIARIERYLAKETKPEAIAA